MEASAWRAPAGLTRRPAPILLRLRSDDQLVALFRLGNDEAFGVIHERYRTRLLAYGRQMLGGSRADAEDALQDVFLRAYHALRADDRPVTLRAWLYRVAHNRCVDQLRKGVAQHVELFENVRSLDDPAAETQRRDDLRRLIADMQRLPEQQRSALLMREMEGLSYAELADALEVTLPAVKSLLVRARMGLVEAQEARDTACADIRADLAGAHDRGVRASGRARRHLRECGGCRDYRVALRAVERGVAALAPPSWGLAAKIFGIGGSGAAAGGAGGTALIAGGATAKVAAVVCCAALVGGGAAVGVRDHGSDPVPSAPTPAKRAADATSAARSLLSKAPATAVARRSGQPLAASPAARRERSARTHRAALTPATAAGPTGAAAVPANPRDAEIHHAQASAGGLLAPVEDSEPPATTTDSEPLATPPTTTTSDEPAAAEPTTTVDAEPLQAPATP